MVLGGLDGGRLPLDCRLTLPRIDIAAWKSDAVEQMEEEQLEEREDTDFTVTVTAISFSSLWSSSSLSSMLGTYLGVVQAHCGGENATSIESHETGFAESRDEGNGVRD